MKIIYILLCCCLTAPLFGQTEEPATVGDDPIEDIIYEVEAEFPGGTGAMHRFIADNIKYPVDAYEQGSSGRVYVQLEIEKDGSITHVRVLRGVSESLDAEAIRVVKTMPKWTPAILNGKPVRCRVTLPFSFHLN